MSLRLCVERNSNMGTLNVNITLKIIVIDVVGQYDHEKKPTQKIDHRI
jgi:hypothetical protein